MSATIEFRVLVEGSVLNGFKGLDWKVFEYLERNVFNRREMVSINPGTSTLLIEPKLYIGLVLNAIENVHGAFGIKTMRDYCTQNNLLNRPCSIEMITTQDKPVIAAVKDDDGKPRFDLIPSYPLEKLAEVYSFGAKKYETHGWRKGFAYSRVFSATMRHLWKYWAGEDNDAESGLPHCAHAMFGCMALIEFSKTKKGSDDRPK